MVFISAFHMMLNCGETDIKIVIVDAERQPHRLAYEAIDGVQSPEYTSAQILLAR